MGQGLIHRRGRGQAKGSNPFLIKPAGRGIVYDARPFGYPLADSMGAGAAGRWGWPVSEISNLLISLAESGGVLIPKRMICDYE